MTSIKPSRLHDRENIRWVQSRMMLDEQLMQTVRHGFSLIAAGFGRFAFLEGVVGGPGEAAHITRMTWYVVDREEYIAAYPAIGRHYRDIIGRHFPAMTAVQVAALVEPRARVEIEVTAVLPPLSDIA